MENYEETTVRKFKGNFHFSKLIHGRLLKQVAACLARLFGWSKQNWWVKQAAAHYNRRPFVKTGGRLFGALFYTDTDTDIVDIDTHRHTHTHTHTNKQTSAPVFVCVSMYV